ncbi:ATP-binding cassette subfamily B protein [Oryzihumus leptocrescens]|uniref:ATP-binding cassette subfamily B protein n=1 Tax=Oryzihumus leptocrescens TaxID=297536 RepID=A0A542ZHN8_9MICO|nr:ATP-binding cassette subfamily B protein [Oryzihumus leptocrescens]
MVSFAPYLRRHRGAFLALLVLSLASAATALAQPWLVGRIIRDATDHRPLLPVLTVAVLVALVDVVLAGGQQYLLQRTAHGLVLGVRVRFIDRMLRLTVPEYDRRSTGDLLARLGNDTGALHAAVTSGGVEAAAAVLWAIGAAVAMALIDLPLLLLALGTFAAFVTASLVASRGVQDLARTELEEYGRMSAAGLRVLGAVRTVRAYGATEQEAGTVAGHARRTYDAGLRHARRAAVVYPTANAGMQASQILLLTVGGIRVASGDLPVASLVSFLLYVNMFVGPVYQLIRAWSSLQQGLGALDRIAEIEGLPAEEEVAAGSVVDRAASRGPGPSVHVGLRGVSFDYGDGSGLHEVSFDVPRGATVALVGPSGAGKSTVLSLIQRFYEPDAGSVVLDGVDLRCLSHRELRERMTYAEQEPAVLEGTVRSNIALGLPDAPESRVRAVLHEVNLATLEHRSPEGLDAAVGERGVRLSGGERQRLTIARALLPGRELLLLDEPTAQLDPANEDQLRQAIRSRQGRTVLVAAHRLSTVLDADRIVVMESGRVVATGTHDELVRCSPLYRSMARAQRLV